MTEDQLWEIGVFKDAHRQAYFVCGFTWKSDMKRLGVPEDWESAWLSMVAETPIEGDCEDVALGVVDWCVQAGIDLNRVGIARVKTRNSQSEIFDHAVAVLLSKSGEVLLSSDCNHPSSVLRKIKGKPYDYISAEALAEGHMPRLFDN